MCHCRKAIRSGCSRWLSRRKNSPVSVRPEQVPLVRKRQLEEYRDVTGLEALSELESILLRLDREEAKEQERQS